MYVYMYIHTASIQVFSMCLYTYIHSFTYRRTQSHTHALVFGRSKSSRATSGYSAGCGLSVQACVCMYAYIYIHIYIHIYMHIHISTHACLWQIQELKGNIRVFCRVRPVLKEEDETTAELALTHSGERPGVRRVLLFIACTIGLCMFTLSVFLTWVVCFVLCLAQVF